MELHFLSRLPQPIQDLAAEIEQAAGLPIAVVQEDDGEVPVDSPSKVVWTTVTESEATIFFFRDSDWDPEYVLHELLHIQRYWVEATPQLEPALRPDLRGNDGNWQITAMLDNALEHLIIWPRMRAFGYRPEVYMTLIADQWARRVYGDIPSRELFITENATEWLQVSRVVSSRPIRKRMLRRLQRDGVLDVCQRFSDAIDEFVQDKREMVRTALDVLGAPRELYMLKVVDPRSRRSRFIEL